MGSSTSLDIAGAVVASAMLIGPLAMAPAYGPFVPPGTAQDFNEATTGERNPGPPGPLSTEPSVMPDPAMPPRSEPAPSDPVIDPPRP